MAMAAQLGYGPSEGQILSLIVGGALVGACVFAGRRGVELQAFTYAIAASWC